VGGLLGSETLTISLKIGVEQEVDVDSALVSEHVQFSKSRSNLSTSAATKRSSKTQTHEWHCSEVSPSSQADSNIIWHFSC
jgi:beta-glucanase (GH16 family)